MSMSESVDKEIQRLQYLEAMGIDSYIPRRTLPGALPSVVFDWPESSVVPISRASDTAIADKHALQKLQQDLGALQRKGPAENKAKHTPAPHVAPAKISSTAAGVLQFQLAIFQPAQDVLVLIPAQHTDAVHLQLLRNILLAISVKTDQLVPLDNFIWPPRVAGAVKINSALGAAQETLHSLLEGYQLKYHTKQVLVFAGALAEKLFPVEANVLCLPDLQQMLEDGAYKKITWQKIRSLVP